jgi:hypothetical protein
MLLEHCALANGQGTSPNTKDPTIAAITGRCRLQCQIHDDLSHITRTCRLGKDCMHR